MRITTPNSVISGLQNRKIEGQTCGCREGSRQSLSKSPQMLDKNMTAQTKVNIHRFLQRQRAVILGMSVLLVLVYPSPSHAKVEQGQCGMARDYWLYTPETINPDQTYWLVVGVHGYRGKGEGAVGLPEWFDRYQNIIVIGPTFPSEGPYYQFLEGDSDRQLLDLFDELSGKFKLHDKMFIHGFSGGSQFAHRFAMKHPEHVIGVSAHSGGTWEQAADADADELIWTISCGLQDTAHSAGAPLTRIEYFRKFCASMLDQSFTVKPFVTDAAHKRTPAVLANAEECFRIATTGMFDFQRKATEGMSPTEREQYIEASHKQLRETEFNDGEEIRQIKVNPDGWVISKKVLRKMKKVRQLNDTILSPN